jgi:isocitrate dehydrogenase
MPGQSGHLGDRIITITPVREFNPKNYNGDVQSDVVAQGSGHSG